MQRSFLLLLCLVSFSLMGQKEKKNNIFKSSGDAAKMSLAKQKYYAGEYGSALSTYKEVEKNNPDNSSVKYYIALCQQHLNLKAQAKISINAAIQLNNQLKPESYLLLAQLLHEEDSVDKALQQLDTFDKLTATKKTDDELGLEAKLCRAQCQQAKNLMAAPLDVSVSNLGPLINSKYDDKNPCISADGYNLVFTTRRPETTNSDRDVEGDGGYFEDIYISILDSGSRSFGQARPASGSINSKAHDACTSISPDGKQIFIYKNDASKAESRGGNIFVSKIAGDKWKAPESLGKPINSSYWEGGACVSPDGKRYFFTSERKGGYGRSDIWMVEKKGKEEWNEPVNLGPEVNSEYDEAGMFLAPDGKTLFFCSNGEKSMGSYDIFKTVYENGKWSAPANLGYPINTTAREGQITLSADARNAYLSSNRKGTLGESDLFMADLRNVDLLEKDGKKKAGNGLTILRGTIREGFEGYRMADVEVKVSNLSSQQLNSTFTNENGEYFFTLGAGTYKLEITMKGYQSITEEFEVSKAEGDTPILEKGYLLKK